MHLPSQLVGWDLGLRIKLGQILLEIRGDHPELAVDRKQGKKFTVGRDGHFGKGALLKKLGRG